VIYWLCGAALFAVAAFAIWRALHNPAVLAGLAKLAIEKMLPVLLKRLPPEQEAEWRRKARDGSKDDPR
jgi:hypothetical protein